MLLIANADYKFEVGGIYHVVHKNKDVDDVFLTVMYKMKGYHLCMQYFPEGKQFRFRALFEGGEYEENVLNSINSKITKIEISYHLLNTHGQTIKQKG